MTGDAADPATFSLRRLDAGREPRVFRTISAKNISPLKTALRTGRRVVEIGTFVPVGQEG